MHPLSRTPFAWLSLSAALAVLPANGEGQISINTVGYLPSRPKLATLAGRPPAFKIVRAGDGGVVFESPSVAAALNTDAGEQVAVADFSSVTQPGEYVMVVDGRDQRVPFRVAANVYHEPFRLATRGMYLWRCGCAVTADHAGVRFHHEACHLEDALTDYVGPAGGRRRSVGGWHDAGDYNKYVVNAGATVGVMFRAWEDFGRQIETIPLGLPEAGGAYPEFLAEIKWELDWLMTMQADDGSVSHKVSTKKFGPFELPELEKSPRYFTPWSSAATADFAAMMAMAARHFVPYDQPYADRCLQAAAKSYAFLHAHPEDRQADLRDFETGGYSSPDGDDRLWAAAELWEATGNGDVLAALEAQLKGLASHSADVPGDQRAASFDADWDWGNLKNLGLFTYIASQRAGRDNLLVEALRRSLISTADAIVHTAAEHAYARPLGDSYYWGCNGSVARQTLLLEAAHRLTRDEKYRNASLDAVHHLLGRNAHGRSYVTGLGWRPPQRPHDRRSGGDQAEPPWPGYLVGGPHPLATDWQDLQDDYRTNEIAINWNAALIYALAANLAD